MYSMQAIFTITTPSHFYLSQVAVNSIVEHTLTSVKIYVFIVGDELGTLANSCKIDRVTFMNVESFLNSETLNSLSYKYTPAELCWLLKSYCFEFMLKNNNQVLYFDSDVYAYSSLNCLFEQFNEHSIILTPHVTAPFTKLNDNTTPIRYLKTGLYNAGFIGIKKTANSDLFVGWWKEVCTLYCENSPQKGLCGDQKWLDLVPIMFENVKIYYHPGANVGHWNIHERKLNKTDDILWVNQTHHLLFFHFSGFNPNCNTQLSSYRLMLTTDSTTQELCKQYATKVIQARQLQLNKAKFKYAKLWHDYAAICRKNKYIKQLFMLL